MALKIRRPYSYETGQLAPVEKQTGRYTRYHLAHSAKGSTWEEHKYVKVIDGTYYYPDSYEGGRHLSDAQKSKFGEYSKDDPDFAESNYSDQNRLGDTDFFGFTKPDGTVVILEEDMKWTLPAGSDLKEMTKRLEAFDKQIEGTNHSYEDWKKMATEAIDGGSSDSGDDDADKIADDVIKGKYGNGSDRKKALGDKYDEVQKRVNKKLKHSDNWTSSLYHHGILRMKWGVRRFQNKDGSLTPAGKARYGSGKKSLGGGAPKAKDLSDDDLKKTVQRKNLENQYNKATGQDKSGLEVTKSMLDSTSNATRQVSNSLRSNNNQKPQRERMDLSDKTNRELQEAITRENLEIQYSNLFGPEKKATGKQKVAQIFDTTGDVLSLASVATSIAIGVMYLKKNGVV